ncbi:BTAD domain-containing putative transcriptional regulator [Microlunatus panaciterrae]|uniref:DNA-binding SARP family transcriptional activator n=1 Tax=Microlunatus panaciterrae TaxID=400768 RepID=A0ABS2RIB8_9ACTN|nr:BTAD domain-containing putative transcriptional regulator [Microlunatus panaciterrae]MBM7798707.1 DNA-binding SARP family transcriptional activator [Microlunatus panaciterrae]
MIFEILGPMTVTGETAVRLLPGSKPRQLLATLLLHPNRYVSADFIADNLWDGQPPNSAAANLRTYVRLLRTRISERTGAATIETRPNGYALMISPDELDSTRLESLVSEARHLSRVGDFAGALALIDQATGLWRGTPLEDVPVCSAWQPQLTRWEMAYTEVLDEAIRLHVDHGDPRRAARLVRDVLDRDPYNEDLWCQLMRCYLAAGQPQFALAAANEGTAVFDTELGVEVGAAFAALAAQARSATTARTAPAGPGLDVEVPAVRDADLPMERQRGRSVPTQLPMDVAGFCGREDQLAELSDALRQRSAARPFVAVLSGPPGVGKTALATRLAHAVRSSFPDGQIFLSLRGTGDPVEPAFAVSEALMSLGVQTIPEQVDRAAALLRSELASRRVLLVLDDAGSASQVSPLIPGTGDSAVLVTSRRRLTDVVGARPFDLDVLDLDSAVAMAAEIAPQRSATDLAALVRACGFHPLAIRIAAARLSRRPDLSAQALVARLTDPDHALNELTLGETAFRTSADLSLRSLAPADGLGYRVLGALDIVEFPGWVVDLSGGSSTTTDALLEENLLQQGRGPRNQSREYRMHDLLRWHAREWGHDHRDEVDLGVRRVLLGWLVLARHAANALEYHYLGNAIDLPAGAPALPVPPGAGADWFVAEQARVAELTSTAMRHGLVDIAWRLACTWSAYFDLTGHTDFWLRLLNQVLPSAHGVDDPYGEATVRRDLGQVLLYRADLDGAAGHLAGSAALFRRLGNVDGVGIAEVGLGVGCRLRGELDQSEAHVSSALNCFQRAGNAHGEAHAMNSMATIQLARGDCDRAEPWLNRAQALAVELGDHHRVAQVLRQIAAMHSRRSDLTSARAAMEEALAIFGRLGDHRCAGMAHSTLARMLMKADDLSGARREFTAALTLADGAGDAVAQAVASEALASVSIRAGRTDEARRYLQRSIRNWQFAALPRDADRVLGQLGRLGR